MIYIYTYIIYLYIYIWFWISFHADIEVSGSRNVFVDTSSSLEWCESAVDVSTCLAPSHSVWSVFLDRYLTPEEHLSLQGIWQQDAENQKAFRKMVSDSKLAKDLAGNSFSATVVQCAVLTSFVVCDGWREVGITSPNQTGCVSQPSTILEKPEEMVERPVKRLKKDHGTDAAETKVKPATSVKSVKPQVIHQISGDSGSVSMPTMKAKGRKRQMEADKHDKSYGGADATEANVKPATSVKSVKPLVIQENSGDSASASMPAMEAKGQKRRLRLDKPDDTLPVPTKRIRKKTTLQPPAPPPKKHGHGVGAGNKDATGKRSMATIAQKEAIMAAYTEAVRRGDRKPTKAVEAMKGYFAGCVYESKWGKQRRQQKWPVLVQTAPRICGACKELPNSLRRILQLPQKKHGNVASINDNGAAEFIHLPFPLQSAVEDLVVQRLELGEEVTMGYVKRILLSSMCMWNEMVS